MNVCTDCLHTNTVCYSLPQEEEDVTKTLERRDTIMAENFTALFLQKSRVRVCSGRAELRTVRSLSPQHRNEERRDEEEACSSHGLVTTIPTVLIMLV